MFPRTAIIMMKLLPAAEIIIVDCSEKSLASCRKFLPDSSRLKFVKERVGPETNRNVDMVVIPLSLIGDRGAMYAQPPARLVLVHDWIWSKQAESVVVSPWLLKRINLVRR